MNSKIYCRHKIKIAVSRNKKICNKTQLWVLNTIRGQTFRLKIISKNSKSRSLIENVYFKSFPTIPETVFLISHYSWNRLIHSNSNRGLG